MKQKFITALLVCTALLTACGSSTTGSTEPPAPAHTHAPSAEWICDFDSHWHPCECGEQLDKAAHTLDGVNCTVCGGEVVTFEDGTKQITVYNSHGDFSQFIFYDADGNVTANERSNFVYDADGNMISMDYHLNGELDSSYEYKLNTDAEPYMASRTSYYEDGSHQTDTFDENFNILRAVYFSAVEKIETDSRYTYNEDGSRRSAQVYQNGALTCEQEARRNEEGFWETLTERYYGEDGSIAYTYDDFGNPLSEIHYKPDGSVDVEYAYENVYDLAGDLMLKRTFTNGVLTMEMEYIYITEADGSTWSRNGKSTEYYGDGTYTIRDGDLENTWSSEITYAADGSVISEVYHEYLYDENGNSLGRKSYENGRLTTEYTEILDENGKSIGLTTTDYHEDGSKTVCEFGEHQELISEIHYNADGNPIDP